jgi:hypothetical protein
MSTSDTALEQNEYRLVLVKAGSRAIRTKRDGNTPRLPRISIPRWARQVEELQRAIEGTWHSSAIILDVLAGEEDECPCAVAQNLSQESPNGLIAVDMDELSEGELHGQERAMIEAIVTGDTRVCGPLAHMHWVEEAMEWVRTAVGHEVDFTGALRQYNAGGGFALIRLDTRNGPAYWLKATGYPNLHEFQITGKLAELCPEFLPRQIAARADWNAWLMEDAGCPLDSWTLPALKQVVRSMAMLQQRTIGQTVAFLAAGAFDQRLRVLRAHLAELFEYLDGAMAKQTSTRVQPIEKRRLWEMARILEDACFRMEELGIPDTLVHNDINSGNILFNGGHCVFTDWCEAAVGNPFLTFQHLCLLQPDGGEGEWIPRLREIYEQCWLDRLSPPQIDRAFMLAPLLAVLSYLYGRGDWLKSSQRNEPHVESYARALARHIDRAAQAPELREALCH